MELITQSDYRRFPRFYVVLALGIIVINAEAIFSMFGACFVTGMIQNCPGR